MTRVAAAVVVIACLAGGWSARSAVRATPSGRRTAVHTCTTSQLKIGLVRSFAGLGTAGGVIGFTNRASAPCRLTGWPTLVALSTAGTSTSAVHSRSTMFGPYDIKGLPVVTLRRGQRGDAVFTGADDPYLGGTRCPSLYRYLRVTPPGDSHGVVLSAWLPWLGEYLPACNRLELSMVVPSSDLYHG